MSISVSDPFGAATDHEMPALKAALDPEVAKSEFKRRLPRLCGPKGKLRLKAIRVTRYKAGRRCVLEYDVQVERSDAPAHMVTLIGKVRARRYGNESYRLLEEIWKAGFQSDSADGISVPEPIGVISNLQMWFQRKVPGKTATELLPGSQGIQLGRRVAEAICKFHRAKVPTDREHMMADELRILRECLAKVVAQKPAWSSRIHRVQEASDRLGASVPEPQVCGVHRDFYPAQVIVDGARVYLIDFDLYCRGDPALDGGNFLGHVIEQSVREHGHADALREVEQAFEERFVELTGESCRAALRAYATLTLVRHVYLSTQFPERLPFTEPFLELCEQRLGLAKEPQRYSTRMR